MAQPPGGKLPIGRFAFNTFKYSSSALLALGRPLHAFSASHWPAWECGDWLERQRQDLGNVALSLAFLPVTCVPLTLTQPYML